MGKKASIMIVDDNANLCRTMFLILSRKGYDVTIATDGSEAIENAKKKGHFDVVFMDIKMPLLDGVETYKRIKRLIPEAAVVMMTAYAVEDMIQEALQEGAYGIIYKPVDVEKAITVIEEARKAKVSVCILVVDDDSGTRITLRSILERRSYDVRTAQTGEEAIAMAQEKCCDISFIDMKLPTMNGLETHLAIREICPESATIITTGYRQEMAELVQSALETNAYACLYKPLDMVEILGLVEMICEKKQKARQLGERKR
jgi:DNA-binding NtrC family response regulator